MNWVTELDIDVEAGGGRIRCPYPAISVFILVGMAVCGLSFVDDYRCGGIKTKNKEYAFQPFVSIIVPIYITKRK